jgi:predicted PurR-regulated permease PerM
MPADMGRLLRWSVMRAESFRWVMRGAGFALGAVLVLGAVEVAVLARDVLLLFFAAILLGSALQPGVDALRSVAGVPRGVIIVAVYAVFFAAVLAVALLVVPAAIAQFSALVGTAPQVFDRLGAWAAGLQPPALSQAASTLVAAARAALRVRPPLPGDIVEAGLTAAEIVFSVITLLALVFFWLVEHARLQRYALSFLPPERRAGAREAWDEVEERLGHWVRGQLILMAVLAIATGFVYSVIGLPSALLLGLFAGLAEVIPIVGPVIGAIPALVIAATIRPELLVVVLVAYLVIQFVEGNILLPIVMKHAIGLSAFLVIASLLVGAAVAGIPGALVAVPLVAGVEVLLERLQARETPVTQAPEEGLLPTEAIGSVARAVRARRSGKETPAR